MPFTTTVSVSTIEPLVAVSMNMIVPVGKYPPDKCAMSVRVEPGRPPDEAVVLRPGEAGETAVCSAGLAGAVAGLLFASPVYWAIQEYVPATGPAVGKVIAAV